MPSLVLDAVGGAPEVLPHYEGRLVRVPAADRRDEQLMLPGSDGAHLRGRFLGLPEGHQERPAEGLDQHLQGRIVRRLRHPGVELERHVHGVVAGAQRLLGPLADLLQIGQVLFGGALADQRHDPHLEDHPHLGDVGRADDRQGEQVSEPLTDPVARGGGDERTASRAHADLDQAAGLEHPQRLADRDPADAETLAQVALRGQPVARLELAIAHQEANLLDDDLGDPADADPVEQLRLGGRRRRLLAGRDSTCRPGQLCSTGRPGHPCSSLRVAETPRGVARLPLYVYWRYGRAFSVICVSRVLRSVSGGGARRSTSYFWLPWAVPPVHNGMTLVLIDGSTGAARC